AEGAHSHWTSYISVPDADVAAERAVALGGKVLEPATDTPYGRIVSLQDPAGALIKAIALPASDEATPPEPEAAGTFSSRELMTPDPEAITPFYETVFGWQRDEGMDMGTDTGKYYIFKSGEHQAAGLMKMPEMVPVPNWLPYIFVDDVDASAAKAAQLGATVYVEPTDIPNI